jgi:hypothetical protein
MTTAHAMHFFPVRMLDSFERMSCMTQLSSAFPSVAFALTLRGRFVQSITGGRFTTVAAVLGQPIFQDL